MALRIREELIGRRFLAIQSGGKLKLSRICDWEWRSGVVRAVSHKDSSHPELAILVEFDDRDWTRREWVRIQTTFQVFLVEASLVYAEHGTGTEVKWCPALSFRPLLPSLTVGNTKVKPIEFFPNHHLGFVEDTQIKPFKEGEPCLTDPELNTEELQQEVKQWIDFQNGLGILITTPSVLVGYRVQVYRTEGTTQWYTAVIQSYNENTQELHVTDDTVLEEHYEDPALVQMNLLGDGVVDSILRGEDIGITPRRRACNNKPSSQAGNTSTANTSGSSKKSTAARTSTKSAGVKPVTQSKVKFKQKANTSSTDSSSQQGRDDIKPKAKPSSIINRKRKSTEGSDSPKPAAALSPKKRSRQSQRQVVKETKITVALERTPIGEPKFVTASGNSDLQKPQVVKEENPAKGSLTKSGKNKEKITRKSISKKIDKPNKSFKADHSVKLDNKLSVKAAKSKGKKAKPKPEFEDAVSPTRDTKLICQVAEIDATNDLIDSRVTCAAQPTDNVIQEIKPERTAEQYAAFTDSSVKDLSSKDTDTSFDESAKMHYKKMRILAEGKKVDTVTTSDSSTGTISESELNLNHSVTDQIAKLTSVKGEKLWNNNDLAASPAYGSVNHAMVLGTDMNNTGTSSNFDESELKFVARCSDEDVKSNFSQNAGASPVNSDTVPQVNVKEEKYSPSSKGSEEFSTKGEEVKYKISSTNSSPLVFNKDEPIKVYRDPELLKKDAEVRQIHGIPSGKTRRETTTPVPQSSAYPSVHNPVATPLPSSMTPNAFAQSPILSSMPAYAQQLSQLGILAASGQHIGLTGHTYDAASPLRGISALAQQQALQLQYSVLLQQQQQQQQQLMSQFSIAGGVPTSHLEMLWQQKYPSLPVPPPWMLLQYQEELLRDVNPVRERELALERERRELEQQALEREKTERERAERNRKEREKAEQERREREDRERAEKIERERKEKELRLEREKHAKIERERVLKESAAAAAAVNAHFLESFRNMKAVAAGTWTPSISIGRPKQNPPIAHSHHQRNQLHHSVKQEHGKLAKDSVGSQSPGHPNSYREANSSIPPPTTKGYPVMEPSQKLRDVLLKTPAATTISDKKNDRIPPVAHSVKQETNFSLYGYQPFQHSYITPDKLYQHGLKDSDKVKCEVNKAMDLKKQTLSPPLLVKNNTSVIVENKAKDLRIPQTAHYGGATHLTSSHPSVISSSAMNSQSSAGSPLHVASPHQLSAEALKPMDLASGSRHLGATLSTSMGQHHSMVTTTTVVSAPTTIPMPVTANFTQNLIQQGLIPNPIYSNGALRTAVRPSVVDLSPGKVKGGGLSVKKSGMSPTYTVGQNMAGSHMAPQKRRSNESGIDAKKPKMQEGPLSLVTSHRSISKPSIPVPSAVSTSKLSPTATSGLASGFMDSFRTFVENAVQSAFYNDTDLNKTKKSPAVDGKTNVQAQANNMASSLSMSLAPTQVQSKPNIPLCVSSAACSSGSMAQLSSSSSIMETINRVANGYIDTDSDTLSAESPPPDIKAEQSISPGPNSNHSSKGFKKAWLQRYSDEDREKKSDAGSTCGEAAYKLPGTSSLGLQDDASTSSASDNDSQEQEKRKHKRRKIPGSSAMKKTKTDDSDNGTSKKKPTRSKKERKSKGESEKMLKKPYVELNLARINENPSLSLANKPLNKIPMSQLKKSGEPFMQEGSCSEVTPKLVKCRECKMTPLQRQKKLPNIFCRFYAFRRLRYSTKGYLSIAGFCEPHDADQEDTELWQPKIPLQEPKLDVKIAKYIISTVGDRFCDLVEQEKEALTWANPDLKIAWKRAVQGVREMCDVCDTTLFNVHWVCQKCGFVICIDCYRIRTERAPGCTDPNCSNCESVGHRWLSCSANRQPHDPEKLMLTQIIPSNALIQLGDAIHDVRDKWKIKCNCPCGRGNPVEQNGVSQQLLSAVSQVITSDSKEKTLVNGLSEDHSKNTKKNNTITAPMVNGSLDNGLSLLASVASMDSENNIEKLLEAKKREKQGLPPIPAPGVEEMSFQEMNELTKNGGNGCSTLLDLLTKTRKKNAITAAAAERKGKTIHSTLDDIIQKVVESNIPVEGQEAVQLKHYIPKNGNSLPGRDSPIPQHTLVETSFLFPEVPHSWLDNGRLLRLHEPCHAGNLKLFQKQWQCGQPVLVSCCDRQMDNNLWNPQAFSEEFGDAKNDLVNCHNGNILVGHKMRDFWDGFERVKERLIDENDQPLILKLKDWPPTEDFSEQMPKHFKDLLEGLPLPEYTHRNGVYNLASRLPEFFVKPDLGPKMYNAYGSALFPKEGTTNLHLDVSDAANVMVYVGIPVDDEFDHRQAALDAIEKAGCDEFTKRRVNEVGELPGALWHIFDARDADKIRDLLNKIAKERGETIEAHHDPIHDQSWYIDVAMQARLQKEYGVVGYTIVQCMGDAIFIPAGAPHQVRNLHSCIKVAEDFVSPEHLNHCFQMTQEFRHLTDTHSNHEDKLQVKNMIFHAVKDAVAILSAENPEN